jgi:hypothetical protein
MNGVGPVGYAQDITFSSSGGNFFTSTTIRKRIEVIGTSLTPADGSTIRTAPWRELAPMATARKNVTASVYNGEIYVFGGLNASNTNLTSVEIYNPTSNTWRAGVSAPIGLGFYMARTVGTRTFLIGSNVAVRVFDHNTNLWSTGAVAPFDDPSFDVDTWVDTVNNRTFVVTIASEFGPPRRIDVFAYEVSQNPNSWFMGTALSTTNFPAMTDHRWFAMRVLGDAVFLTGGHRQFISSSDAFGGMFRNNLATGVWTTSGLGTLQVPRNFARAVTLDGTMHLIGGRNGAGTELRDMESYNVSTATWTALPRMLRPRVFHAAVALDGKIYVIGGQSDNSGTPIASVDVFTP